MNRKPIILLSCEHAVNHVPAAYQDLFAKQHALLTSHRGIDFGALAIAQSLAQALNIKLICATTSRLLIDCNRSLTHPHCFSEVTKHLPTMIKQQIIAQYYLPYRQAVEQVIQTNVDNHHQVIHLSIHSFTPQLHGTIREVDIGLLYDPKRAPEKNFAQQWKNSLKKQANHLRIRLNSPYQGTSDGFTTALRKKFPPELYLGIEVESNQALLRRPSSLEHLANTLLVSLPTLRVKNL